MRMDYHHPYNVYPEYYCGPYQGAMYPSYPYQSHHPPPSHHQGQGPSNVPGPVRNFNNNIVGHQSYLSCPPQQHPPSRLPPNQPYYNMSCQQQNTPTPRQHSTFSSSQSPYVPNFLVSSGTGLTPTLTPTTLATIEQSFLELQSAQQNGGRDPTTQSGFVPPVVDPGHSAEQSQDSNEYSSSDAEWEPNSKRARMSQDIKDVNLIVTPHGTINATPQRKYTRRNKDEKLPPEEERRREVRRERNKLAAAKCRQRRVDHTNELVEETEKLEAEQRGLESEIQSLQQEREQLEFILQAHQPMCKVDPMRLDKVKGEVKVVGEPSMMHSHSHPPPPPPSAAVPRPENLSLQSMMGTPVTTNGKPTHTVVSTSSLPVSSVPAVSPTSSMATSRPNSLPLIKRDRARMLSMTSATGITINTPTSGVAITPSSLIGPGLDSMVDGSTGLTPITGMSCSSQVQRNGSESSSEAVGSPTLISL